MEFTLYISKAAKFTFPQEGEAVTLDTGFEQYSGIAHNLDSEIAMTFEIPDRRSYNYLTHWYAYPQHPVPLTHSDKLVGIKLTGRKIEQ